MFDVWKTETIHTRLLITIQHPEGRKKDKTEISGRLFKSQTCYNHLIQCHVMMVCIIQKCVFWYFMYNIN